MWIHSKDSIMLCHAYIHSCSSDWQRPLWEPKCFNYVSRGSFIFVFNLEIIPSVIWKAQINYKSTWKLNWYVLTLIEILVNQMRLNVYEHTAKMTPCDSYRYMRGYPKKNWNYFLKAIYFQILYKTTLSPSKYSPLQLISPTGASAL